MMEFVDMIIYRHMATFQDKKAAEGSLMTRYAQGRKCAKVRTKKEKCYKSLHKKRAVMYFGKFEKVRAKKGISLHDIRTRGKVQKCTEMHTKKRKLKCREKPNKKRVCGHDMRAGVSRHFGHPKKRITKKY